MTEILRAHRWGTNARMIAEHVLGLPVVQMACGCIIATDTRVVVFARDDCTAHTAGRTIPDDPQFAEWVELGEPVG